MRGRGPKVGRLGTTWQEIRQRITGISTPWIGLQWSPPEPERLVVRELLIFLADRRVLFNAFDLEVPGDVTHSLDEIRKEITRTLQRLNDTCPAAPPVRQMRGACRRFMDGHRPEVRLHGMLEREANFLNAELDEGFFVELGQLRATFGRAIAELSALYEIDVSPDLETILPDPE